MHLRHHPALCSTTKTRASLKIGMEMPDTLQNIALLLVKWHGS
jgi:hypothetical protein